MLFKPRWLGPTCPVSLDLPPALLVSLPGYAFGLVHQLSLSGNFSPCALLPGRESPGPQVTRQNRSLRVKEVQYAHLSGEFRLHQELQTTLKKCQFPLCPLKYPSVFQIEL